MPSSQTAPLSDSNSIPGTLQARSCRFPQSTEKRVSGFTYFLYLYYTISYFLHFGARFQFLGVIHSDQIIAGILIISLFAQHEILKGRLQDRSAKIMLILLAYIVITLPFVEWPGSIVHKNFQFFFKSFVFFPFTVLIIDTDKRFKRFLFLFVACQVFRVLEPVYLHITTGYLGDSTYIGGGDFAGRLSGAPSDIINSNGLGFVITTSIPFLHYFLAGRSYFSKALYASILAVLLYALVLTMSRGGFIALLIVFGVIFFQSRHKALLAILAIFIAIGIWAHLNPIQKDRYLSLTGANVTGHTTAVGRIDGLLVNLKTGLQRPIVGHGLGTSLEATVHYAHSQYVAHNMYLEIFIELGIGGLVIFLAYFKSVYDDLQRGASTLNDMLKYNQAEYEAFSFQRHLSMALRVVFWMYIVFCLNYFGVSDYYWYLLGGMAFVLLRQIAASKLPSTSEVQMASSKSPLAAKRFRNVGLHS